MLKKLLIVLLSMSATMAIAGDSQLNFVNGAHIPVGLDTYAGNFFGWLASGNNTPAKTAVTGLLAYCVAYTLYQTAKGVGSTLWTWWHGEELSPVMQRQVELYVTEMIRKNGTGHLALRRAQPHDETTCMCSDCSETRRVRQ